MITYPIHEMFMTFQGEGCAMGLPSFFVRTFGCPVKCTFCDSAGTWHPDWVPKHVERLSVQDIVAAVLSAKAERVVITGGEPAIFDLAPLVYTLQSLGIEVALETSGAFSIRADFDWVTLSPKRAELPLQLSVLRADEFKVIVEKPDDISYFFKVLSDHLSAVRLIKAYPPIWLHPEWSQRENKAVLAAIVSAVKEGRGVFRAGWQLHKLYAADSFDSRSKPLVPLGGDLSKGY